MPLRWNETQLSKSWYTFSFASVILDQASIVQFSSTSGCPNEWAQAITLDILFPLILWFLTKLLFPVFKCNLNQASDQKTSFTKVAQFGSQTYYTLSEVKKKRQSFHHKAIILSQHKPCFWKFSIHYKFHHAFDLLNFFAAFNSYMNQT